MSDENIKKNNNSAPDRIVINTGSSKFSFTPDWVENEGLNSILTGLVADDLNRHLNNDTRL